MRTIDSEVLVRLRVEIREVIFGDERVLTGCLGDINLGLLAFIMSFHFRI